MTLRNVFFSFEWDDVWVVNQIRNMNVINCVNELFRDHAEIEEVKRHSDESIKHWINHQLEGASVTCVLIGEKTHKSQWVNYEIERSKILKKGLLGICVHNLKTQDGKTTNPGDAAYFEQKGMPVYNPSANDAYNNIKNNIKKCIEDAAAQVGR